MGGGPVVMRLSMRSALALLGFLLSVLSGAAQVGGAGQAGAGQGGPAADSKTTIEIARFRLDGPVSGGSNLETMLSSGFGLALLKYSWLAVSLDRSGAPRPDPGRTTAAQPGP